ncbi:hypothetical protein ACN4GN_22965, partial [Burkholderia pseudomallei]
MQAASSGEKTIVGKRARRVPRAHSRPSRPFTQIVSAGAKARSGGPARRVAAWPGRARDGHREL